MNYTPEFVARFWGKVDKSRGPDACWLWTAALSDGYGAIGLGRGVAKAHRVAWELEHGEIPAEGFSGYHGACILHLCDVRRCVNPKHMRLGTQAENLRDMSVKMRNPRGERHWKAKLTAGMVIALRSALSAGESFGSASKRLGLPRGAAYHVAQGSTWRHLAKSLRFEDQIQTEEAA